MKKIIILLLAVQISGTVFSQSSNSDSVIRAVENFNYSGFVDRTINDLIVIDPVSRYIQYTYTTSQPSTLSGVRFKYSDSVFLEIYVSPIRYQDSFNESGNWDFSLMRKEKIFKMKILVNGRVYRERGKVL